MIVESLTCENTLEQFPDAPLVLVPIERDPKKLITTKEENRMVNKRKKLSTSLRLKVFDRKMLYTTKKPQMASQKSGPISNPLPPKILRKVLNSLKWKKT